jgi:hypothetical protein
MVRHAGLFGILIRLAPSVLTFNNPKPDEAAQEKSHHDGFFSDDPLDDFKKLTM